MSPCELEKSHFIIHAEGQSSLTKAVNSNGQRNRSSMESILAPPCYSSFDVHFPCLGPMSCSFSHPESPQGAPPFQEWLHHHLFTDVTGDIFSLQQIFTKNFHILSCSLRGYIIIWILREGNKINLSHLVIFLFSYLHPFGLLRCLFTSLCLSPGTPLKITTYYPSSKLTTWKWPHTKFPKM